MNEAFNNAKTRFEKARERDKENSLSGETFASVVMNCVLASVILAIAGPALLKAFSWSTALKLAGVLLIGSAFISTLIPFKKLEAKFGSSFKTIKTLMFTLLFTIVGAALTAYMVNDVISEEKTSRYSEIMSELTQINAATIDMSDYEIEKELGKEGIQYVTELAEEAREIENYDAEAVMTANALKVGAMDFVICLILFSMSGTMTSSISAEYKRQLAIQNGENVD